MTEDRGWVVRAALDPQATRGEFEAWLAAATETERAAIRTELELAIRWQQNRQRDVEAKLAHLREQWPGPTRGVWDARQQGVVPQECLMAGVRFFRSGEVRGDTDTARGAGGVWRGESAGIQQSAA